MPDRKPVEDSSFMPESLFHPDVRSLSVGIVVVFALLTSLFVPVCASAGEPGYTEKRPSQEIDRLFREDMKQANANLKWHGERLTEDTVYAVALTGLSWELAWNKDHLFSLG